MQTNTPSQATSANGDAVPRLLLPALRGLYERGEQAGYALLRACFGIVMLSHGLPKLLRTSHGSMRDPMAASTGLIENVLGLPFAPAIAMFVALLEGLGGAMLVLGLATRPISLMIAVQMLVISYILGPTWPWVDRGIEFPVLMAFLALFMAFKGSGRYSLDRMLGKEI